VADPSRRASAQALIASERPRRVLDVGCGAGQELAPYAEAGVRSVGVDVSREALDCGRRFYGPAGIPVPGFFVGRAESLPYASGVFDVVLCRVALPYTDNERAVAEMSRVLRPGGLLLLKYHHRQFYLGELREKLRAGDVRAALGRLRILANGALWLATGRQMRTRLLGFEIYQTEKSARRLLGRHALDVVARGQDDHPLAPSVVARKRMAGGVEPTPLQLA
jgi:SAM-dependent methyltransferase